MNAETFTYNQNQQLLEQECIILYKKYLAARISRAKQQEDAALTSKLAFIYIWGLPNNDRKV